MQTPEFRPGFRLSATDLIVIAIGVTAAILVWNTVWWLGLTVLLVIGHFFLFCNVFRIGRHLELAWSAVFITVTGGTVAAGIPGWPWAIAIALVGAAVVIIIEMRKPSYHGVAWQRVNPNLKNWWDAQHNDIV